MLYGAGIRGAPDTWQYGSQNFHVQNILVGQEDGDAVLQRLHEKAARGEAFTAADRVDPILSPLMRQNRPVQDVLCAAAPLTQRLPAAQQEPTLGALLGLAYHYVQEDVVRAILEELSMANPLQELIDERVAQGEIRGKREALRTVLRGRFGALPEAVEQRIAAADVDQLDAFLGRAATVARPDEL